MQQQTLLHIEVKLATRLPASGYIQIFISREFVQEPGTVKVKVAGSQKLFSLGNDAEYWELKLMIGTAPDDSVLDF